MSTPKLGTDDAWWGEGSRYDATKRAIESIGLEERWCEVLKVAGYDDLDLAKLGSMDSVQLGTLGQRLGMDDASSVAFASRFGDAARVEALKMVEAIGGDKASLDEKVERLKQQAEEEEALIRKAAAMLNNPRVVDTTVEQRIDFLRSKGLTASQERSSTLMSTPPRSRGSPALTHRQRLPRPSPWRRSRAPSSGPASTSRRWSPSPRRWAWRLAAPRSGRRILVLHPAIERTRTQLCSIVLGWVFTVVAPLGIHAVL